MKPSNQFSKSDIIQKYLYKDLDRFLKRYYRFNKFELTYSVTLPQYEEQVPGITKKILKLFKGEYPGTISNIINVHRVMVKYYGFYIDIEDIEICRRIENCLDSSYTHFRQAQYNKKKRLGLSIMPKLHKKHQAVEELKARGFVKKKKFKDYDKRFSHITTNKVLDIELYYPKNFTIGVIKGENWWEVHNAYIVHGLIGVTGYTQVKAKIN